MSIPTILLAIEDFFFVAKVEGTLQQYGYSVVRGGDQQALLEVIARDHPSCLVVDLNNRRCEPLSLIERLKGDQESSHLPILAYTNHSDLEGIRRALTLGADKVVSRSEFSSYLPRLVGGLLGVGRQKSPPNDP